MTVSEYTTVRTLQYGASLALASIQDGVIPVWNLEEKMDPKLK